MAISNEKENVKNQDFNALGSQYAAEFGHGSTGLLERELDNMILDTAPKMFADLKLLSMVKWGTCIGDELSWKESGEQRVEITSNGTSATVSYPNTQTFSVTSMEGVAKDVLIAYPNGAVGNITDFNTTSQTITVSPQVNGTLPAVVSGASFANIAPIQADGKEGFGIYFSMQTIERTAYLQMGSIARVYSEMVMRKHQQLGTTKNFLAMEYSKMMLHIQTSIANTLWLGKKGEIKTAEGIPAKTTGGVFEAMLDAGATSANGVTPSTLVDSFESVVFASEYGSFSGTRFCFATSENIRLLSRKYKEELTQYKPDDTTAMLNLNAIDVGSSKIVLVPNNRFRHAASFPAMYLKTFFILDIGNIKPFRAWGDRTGTTLSLKDGVPVRTTTEWIDVNFGFKFENPLSNAYLQMA